MAWGVRYWVGCADDDPFERSDRIAAQVSPVLGLGGIDEGTASPGECSAWKVSPAPGIENEAVKSDVPALIFAGEWTPTHRRTGDVSCSKPCRMRWTWSSVAALTARDSRPATGRSRGAFLREPDLLCP
jgi:hypothetical protein